MAIAEQAQTSYAKELDIDMKVCHNELGQWTKTQIMEGSMLHWAHVDVTITHDYIVKDDDWAPEKVAEIVKELHKDQRITRTNVDPVELEDCSSKELKGYAEMLGALELSGLPYYKVENK